MPSTRSETHGQRLTKALEIFCLAGHFMGEGSLGWYTRGPVVSVKSCVEEELFLYPRYFGGRMYVNEEPRSDAHRRAYRWMLNGQNAIKFCREIHPFLWAHKATQCRLMIQAWEAFDEERDDYLKEIKGWKRV